MEDEIKKEEQKKSGNTGFKEFPRLLLYRNEGTYMKKRLAVLLAMCLVAGKFNGTAGIQEVKVSEAQQEADNKTEKPGDSNTEEPGKDPSRNSDTEQSETLD